MIVVTNESKVMFMTVSNICLFTLYVQTQFPFPASNKVVNMNLMLNEENQIVNEEMAAMKQQSRLQP